MKRNPNGAVEKTGIGYGKSQPVDEYDSAFKRLHGGYADLSVRLLFSALLKRLARLSR
jgi:hypothetical protein